LRTRKGGKESGEESEFRGLAFPTHRVQKYKKKGRRIAEKELTRENLKENCIWKLPIPDERKRGKSERKLTHARTHSHRLGGSQYDLNTYAHTGDYSDVNAGSAVGVAVDVGREVCVVCMTIHLFLINAIYQTQTTSDSKR